MFNSARISFRRSSITGLAFAKPINGQKKKKEGNKNQRIFHISIFPFFTSSHKFSMHLSLSILNPLKASTHLANEQPQRSAMWATDSGHIHQNLLLYQLQDKLQQHIEFIEFLKRIAVWPNLVKAPFKIVEHGQKIASLLRIAEMSSNLSRLVIKKKQTNKTFF